MAKKLNVELNFTTKEKEICGEQIEIKQYLPVAEKLSLVTDVLNQSAGENSFPNPIQIEVFSSLNIVKYYSDIEISDEDLDNPAETFDKLQTNGIINAVIEELPYSEYNEVMKAVEETIDNYYNYKNSTLGILSAVSQDYSQLDIDATDIQKKIADPNNLTLLKDVMNKLG